MITRRYEQKYLECVVKRANEILRHPVCVTTRDAYFEYFKTGNRLIYERQYFGKREYLTVLSVIQCLRSDIEKSNEWKKAYDDTFFAVVESVLNEPTWVLPAHGSKSHYEEKTNSIDLFAAETAGSLAEILCRVAFDKAEDKERHKELSILFLRKYKEKVLDIFLSAKPCDWWESARMNWSAVCAGNMAIAIYYASRLEKCMLDEKKINCSILNISRDDYNDIFNRVTESMKIYLTSMSRDGVCFEGTGYYKYGMEYFLGFYELLEKENRKDCIDKIGRFEAIAKFLQGVYLGGGKCVNFSDCELNNKTKMGIIAYLSKLYEEVEISRDFISEDVLELNSDITEILGGDECHRFFGALYDYLWVKRYGENIRFYEGCKENVFEDAMWYIYRWNENTSFYIKGGDNDESHNHNDVGSFAYISDGEEILCELGAGEYTKDYFGEKRYEYLCTGSIGHNVPVIDGKYQLAGKKYKAESFLKKGNTISIDIGPAYGMDMGKAVRQVEIKSLGGIVIRDMVYAETVIENFVTKTEPTVKGNYIYIGGSGAYLKIDEKALISVEKKLHNDHSGKEVAVYLIQAKYTGNNALKTIEISVGVG